MQGHDVLLDWENGRVGFAKSSCSNNELGKESNEEIQILVSEGAAVGAEGTVVDCVLGSPSVSITCTDSMKEEIEKYCSNAKVRLLDICCCKLVGC